ncbi:MAG: tail fiber domain-containing protein, partial [Planctomycetes bacterium]|nr:tail fiber domain-containing protein [Planctomycetota bacterium]
DAQTGGTLFGETTQNVDVADGVFSAELNFGTLSTIDPASAWLEIAVSTGPGTFETLGRQKITSAPFATNTRGLNVDSSGRLSVGTTSHEDILHIAGINARILTESTGGFFSGIRSRVGGREFFTGVDTFPGAANGGAGWHVFDNSSAARRLALLANGNFGVGVSIPQARLDVAGGALFAGSVGIGNTNPNLPLAIESDSSGNTIGLRSNAGGSDWHLDFGAGGLQFVESGVASRVVMKDGGGLQVDGGIVASGRSRLGNLVFAPISATVDIVGQASDTFALVVEDPNGIYRFSVNNNGDVATQCGIICASDERLKEDIVDLESPLEKIMALRDVTFTWKDETLAKRGTQIGFVAQEVQKVLPELIGETPDGFLGVDYASMAPVLVGGIQEQQAQIDTMQSQIADLQAQIESLQNQRSMAGASMVWPVLIGGGLIGGLAVIRRRTAKA